MMKQSNRKAIVTDEHRLEARKLKAIWDAAPDRLGQREFGKRYGVGSQSAVSQFLGGLVALSLDAARGFAAGLGCKIEDFSPRLAAEIAKLSTAVYIPDMEMHTDAVPVRKVIFKISAGIAGFAVEYLDNGDGEPIYQPLSWFERRGIDPAKVYAARVGGRSMEPKYFSNDVVMIDTGNVERERDAVYAFNHEGEFVVKRLRYTQRRWWLFSDNPDQKEFYPQQCSENTYIIGRIVLHVSETL